MKNPAQPEPAGTRFRRINDGLGREEPAGMLSRVKMKALNISPACKRLCFFSLWRRERGRKDKQIKPTHESHPRAAALGEEKAEELEPHDADIQEDEQDLRNGPLLLIKKGCNNLNNSSQGDGQHHDEIGPKKDWIPQGGTDPQRNTRCPLSPPGYRVQTEMLPQAIE